MTRDLRNFCSFQQNVRFCFPFLIFQVQIISAEQIEQFWCLDNYELFVSGEKQLADPLFSPYSEVQLGMPQGTRENLSLRSLDVFPHLVPRWFELIPSPPPFLPLFPEFPEKQLFCQFSLFFNKKRGDSHYIWLFLILILSILSNLVISDHENHIILLI